MVENLVPVKPNRIVSVKILCSTCGNSNAEVDTYADLSVKWRYVCKWCVELSSSKGE